MLGFEFDVRFHDQFLSCTLFDVPFHFELCCACFVPFNCFVVPVLFDSAVCRDSYWPHRILVNCSILMGTVQAVSSTIFLFRTSKYSDCFCDHFLKLSIRGHNCSLHYCDGTQITDPIAISV